MSDSSDKLKCQYDGCEEEFDEHKERLAHSMEEHRDLDPYKYSTLTGKSRFG